MGSLKTKQTGAISIFVVVFTALLITVITLSFVRLMLRDQQQASSTDLSQSAYDSATAGVEDAKRALLKYRQACAADPSGPECVGYKTALASGNCGTISGILYNNPNAAETLIQTNQTEDAKLDQAYTCATVNLNTDDYVGILGADESDIISLNGVGTFDTIQIEWHNDEDLPAGTTTYDLLSPADINAVNRNLLAQSDWPTTRPSILRSQLFHFNSSSGFDLEDLDDNSGNTGSNTLFLYPTQTSVGSQSFSLDARRSSSNAPVAVPCRVDPASDVTWGIYSCKSTINLTRPVTSNDVAYLRVSALYSKTYP